ncbi:maleylacetoacetate isomerase [Thioclava nitratireducens]|uniref:Maleylacetoacetate isomerase n=1 Tax=Thioclava nitratireducens TaxID=1915078 RepID=A0ABN4XAJ8_9RHOB|nr:maleylacetoacetate isomerase [Thioclava nitratireducens]AQS47276.1 maleylacetoacetate isomerase [Thioclava nitratireducens]
MTRLHDYWRSSASYRVRIALALAGIEWQAAPVDLTTGAQRDPDYLAVNPQGLVPTLEIDGDRFTQSLAIVEYLNETRALGLLPEAPADRAHVRALAQAIAVDIHPVCNLRVAKHAVAASNGAITMESWMQTFIAPGLAAVEEMISGESFCWRDQLTLADLCLVPQIYNARRWGIDLAPMPNITRIAAHLETLPAFAAARPAPPAA